MAVTILKYLQVAGFSLSVRNFDTECVFGPKSADSDIVRPQQLSEEEKSRLSEDLPEWTVADASLVRRFQFDTFADAMRFMTSMAVVSEELNHHPTWTNTYNTVDVSLTTHDAGGLSGLDRRWAEAANALCP